MLPGKHAETGGRSYALGGELADMERRIGDVARALASIGVYKPWTPVITQGSAISTSVAEGRFVEIGDTVIGTYRLDTSANGTGGNAITISLPVTVRTGHVATWWPVRVGSLVDAFFVFVSVSNLTIRRATTSGLAAAYTTQLVSGSIVQGAFQVERA